METTMTESLPTPYEDLLGEVMRSGPDRGGRTGTGTRALFGKQSRYGLSAGFPPLTSTRVHMKSIVHELLWSRRGYTRGGWLQERGVSIWDEWEKEDGSI